MTTTETTAVKDAPARRIATAAHKRRRWLWPLAVVLVTAVYACIPYLAHPYFFQRGDTAAQFAPTWFNLGEMVRSGQWPPWLDPDAWAGGNYAAEALYGIYNPLNILVWLWMSAASDLMFATFVVKLVVLVALALGAYLLAREYGASDWAAAVVATALPFSGFTLYWDAGSWPSGLMAFAYATWLWWVLRRCLRGVTNPLWGFLVGVLTVTQGNPYGTLAVVVVGVGLVVEGWLSRNRDGVVRLVLLGLCIAAFLPLVFLPLVETADLAVRSQQGGLIENSGKLRPGIGDLLGLSSPTFVPDIRAITGPMKVPATYFFWLVLPLLPWLRYGVLRDRARELSGLGVVTVIYLALTVGPSKLWLFRWPLRLVEYAWLGIAVVFAVVLSQGLQRTHVRGRVLGSLAIVLGAGYLAWAQRPAAAQQVAAGVLLVVVLVAAVLAWVHWREKATAGLAALCILGTGAVLGLQVHAFGENASSRFWHLPRDVAAIQERFGDRDGRVMQFADLKPLQQKHPRELVRAWDTFLPGSMYQVAGVDAVNAYTGMGMRVFNRHFCMEYDGLTQPCGYWNLWTESAIAGVPVADLMKIDTVVVQPEMAVGEMPAGWTVEEQTDAVVVMTRDEPLPWPDARLSWAADGIEVESAETVEPLHEQVEISDSGDGGKLIFAALGWPGWQAELDGEPVKVSRTKIGMLMVEVPPGASGTLDVTYRPPGLNVGLAAAGIGTLGALALGLVDWRRRRRARPEEGAIPHVVEDRPSE